MSDDTPIAGGDTGYGSITEQQDSDTDWRIDDYLPKDPSEYGFTDHCRDRVNDDTRPVSWPLVDHTIIHGEYEPRHSGSGWKIVSEVDGIEIVAGMDINHDLAPEVVTVYGRVVDPDEAAASQWYTDKAVAATITQGYLIDRDECPYDDLSSVELHTPVEVGDHEVISYLGHPHAECRVCGLITHRRGTFTGTACDDG